MVHRRSLLRRSYLENVANSEDLEKLRSRELPKPYGVTSNEKAKERRKEASKRYRKSEIGRARARRRRAIESVNNALIREWLKQHPDMEEYYRKKYFTHRFDRVGSEEEKK